MYMIPKREIPKGDRPGTAFEDLPDDWTVRCAARERMNLKLSSRGILDG